MKNIGYVIRLHHVRNRYVYGLSFRQARVFLTREAARVDKRGSRNCRVEKIIQVMLFKNGTPKKIIKEVR